MPGRICRSFALLSTLLAALLAVGAALAPEVAASGHPGRDHLRRHLDASTIPQLERQMDRGDSTSVRLVRFYFHRIEKLNPELHAIITTSPTAIAEARAADQARSQHRNDERRFSARHPLLGIPIIVKDNIDTPECRRRPVVGPGREHTR